MSEDMPHIPKHIENSTNDDCLGCQFRIAKVPKLQKSGIQKQLQKIGLDIPAERYWIQLLGKVNYVLQTSPNDPDMLNAKKWLRSQ